jgi:Uroporphyrinogen-III decarboxylase
MKGRALVDATINGKSHEKHAFWVGHPTDEAKSIFYKVLGIRQPEETQLEKHNAESTVLLCKKGGFEEIQFNIAINSDMTWITPELDISCWKHPEGRPMWDCFKDKRHSLNEAGVFAECDDVADVEKFEWPNPAYLDITSVIEECKSAYEKGLAVFGGMWCPFFHIVSDFFGMENYFVKMYTDPEVVQAVTRHVVDFLLETNKSVLNACAPYLSAGFFGNDLGTQISLLISPENFDKFILPYIQEIISVIKSFNLKAAMHSCGSVDMIIPRLIDAGVDILHPLQAKAKGMDAKNLAKKYGGRIAFMGGVDTQELLPFGTKEQVREEVLRLRDVFKDGYIVSPSHEALLPNVPYENVLTMSGAAKE